MKSNCVEKPLAGGLEVGQEGKTCKLRFGNNTSQMTIAIIHQKAAVIRGDLRGKEQYVSKGKL